jgi:hypothetical protein
VCVVHQIAIAIRVARWDVYCVPIIPILVYFEGPWNGKCWYILWQVGLFYGHWVYLVAIWFILWSFGTFFPE